MVKKKYGLSLEEYEAIIARGCAICGTTEGRICLDHCHETGELREALCNKCNTGLGMFNDDFLRVERASEYLSRHSPDSCRVAGRLVKG